MPLKKYPPELRKLVVSMRGQKKPAPEIRAVINVRWPEFKDMTRQKIYNIHRTDTGLTARDSRSYTPLEKTPITLGGPAWSVEGIKNVVAA